MFKLKTYLEIARFISLRQTKTWEYGIASPFLIRSLFQAKSTLLLKSAGGDGSCEVCLRLPHLEILMTPENSI